MKEEINKNPLNQTPNPEFLEKRIFELRRRAFGLIHSFVTREWQWPKSVKGDKKRNFIDKLVEGTTKIVPEATDEIKTRFETLNAIDEIKDLESLLKKATEIHIELLTKYLSLEELEKRLRDRAIQGKGYQELSRGLCFRIIWSKKIIIKIAQWQRSCLLYYHEKRNKKMSKPRTKAKLRTGQAVKKIWNINHKMWYARIVKVIS